MKNIRKLISFFSLFIVLTFLLVSCAAGNESGAVSSDVVGDASSAQEDKTQIRIAVLNGTTGFGIAPLFSKVQSGASSLDAKIDFYGDASLIPPMLISGNVDVAAVPTNLAAVVYAKTSGRIKVLAVNTLGVLYLLENGNTVNSLADLKGKTVYVPGQNSNPEYVLKGLLSAAGLEKDVTVDGTTYPSPDALTAALAGGLADVGVLPEPKVTAAVMQAGEGKLRVALDFTKEWKDATGTDLVQGCLIVRKEFADEHPDVIEEFLMEYRVSVDTVNTDPETAAGMIVSAGLAAKEALVIKSLPRCNIVCMTGDDMKTSLMAFWKALFDVVPSSVGGSLPDDDIF